MQEFLALRNSDQAAGQDEFYAIVWKHAAHSLKNAFRARGTGGTNALTGGSPADAGKSSVYYKRLGRYAAGFSLVSEAAIFTLGGALKRREMLSARLGDVLAELYLLSAVLKRW